LLEALLLKQGRPSVGEGVGDGVLELGEQIRLQRFREDLALDAPVVVEARPGLRGIVGDLVFGPLVLALELLQAGVEGLGGGLLLRLPLLAGDVGALDRALEISIGVAEGDALEAAILVLLVDLVGLETLGPPRPGPRWPVNAMLLHLVRAERPAWPGVLGVDSRTAQALVACGHFRTLEIDSPAQLA
jgi:hypothetical protein